MAFWNFVLEIDYDTFNIVNAVSSPWMADLHGLACDERHLYVTSTAVTSLLALDLNDLSPCWQWGPKEELLLRGGSWWSRWRAGQASLAGDYRHRHKSRSPHYRHHLNDVRYHQGHLYLTTLKWWDKVGGGGDPSQPG